MLSAYARYRFDRVHVRVCSNGYCGMPKRARDRLQIGSRRRRSLYFESLINRSMLRPRCSLGHQFRQPLLAEMVA
jgi:hypothetical protein